MCRGARSEMEICHSLVTRISVSFPVSDLVTIDQCSEEPLSPRASIALSIVLVSTLVSTTRLDRSKKIALLRARDPIARAALSAIATSRPIRTLDSLLDSRATSTNASDPSLVFLRRVSLALFFFFCKIQRESFKRSRGRRAELRDGLVVERAHRQVQRLERRRAAPPETRRAQDTHLLKASISLSLSLSLSRYLVRSCHRRQGFRTRCTLGPSTLYEKRRESRAGAETTRAARPRRLTVAIHNSERFLESGVETSV